MSLIFIHNINCFRGGTDDTVSPKYQTLGEIGPLSESCPCCLSYMWLIVFSVNMSTREPALPYTDLVFPTSSSQHLNIIAVHSSFTLHCHSHSVHSIHLLFSGCGNNQHLILPVLSHPSSSCLLHLISLTFSYGFFFPL